MKRSNAMIDIAQEVRNGIGICVASEMYVDVQQKLAATRNDCLGSFEVVGLIRDSTAAAAALRIALVVKTRVADAGSSMC